MADRPDQRSVCNAPGPLRALRIVGTMLFVTGAASALSMQGARRAYSQAPQPSASIDTAQSASLPLGSASSPAPPASSAPPVVQKVPWPADPEDDVLPKTLAEQRARLFHQMRQKLGLSEEAMGKVEPLFASSPIMGQGNPLISVHPMTPKECREIRDKAELTMIDNPKCGARNMVPLYDPSAGQTEESSKVCIDQYEFPNIPCEYPVVHVSALEAAELCLAVGKRICDAHEWEGACAGALRPPEAEYAFGKERHYATYLHNNNRELIWAYGKEKDHNKCATHSIKTKGCNGGGYGHCGSNTYPAGAFPQCVSPFGVFDLHGNAAEHMNLPTRPEEMASRGQTYGQTEMKGSWFIFSAIEAHKDDCHWRAPDWHGTRVMDKNSHANYHLGFRCCKDLP